MTADFNFQVQTPRLRVTPNPVTRGSTATFEVLGARGATFSQWKYTMDGYPTYTRETDVNTNTWPGTIVVGGTGSVTVSMAGRTIPLSTSLTVSSRANWAFVAGPHSKEAWGFQTPSGAVLNPTDPPVSLAEVGGKYAVELHYDFDSWKIGDGGPNEGFLYVKALSDQSSPSAPTKFYWTVIPSLENPQSTFFMKQCGNYHEVDNPTGYIDGNTLLAGVKSHEAEGSSSHYQQYVTAQNIPANNMGVYAESLIGTPDQTVQDFDEFLNTQFASRITAIKNATQSPEPRAVNVSVIFGFMGYINLSPYDPNAGC